MFSSNLNSRALNEWKQYVIDPLAKKMDSFESELKTQLQNLRVDFNKSLDQNAAILRAVTDPTTGYVPRSEITLIRERADEDRERLRKEFDDRLREQSEAFDRKLDRAVNQIRWLGGAIVAVTMIIFVVLTYIRPTH